MTDLPHPVMMVQVDLKWSDMMSTISKKFIRLDQTTRVHVLDIGDKQIFVQVETDPVKPPASSQQKAPAAK